MGGWGRDLVSEGLSLLGWAGFRMCWSWCLLLHAGYGIIHAGYSTQVAGKLAVRQDIAGSGTATL